MIRIIPDIPRINARWCRRTSEIPDFLEVPMSNGETVRYYPQIEQPAFRASLETIRKMNQMVVGYENKNGR